jgi:hypothetical protein
MDGSEEFMISDTDNESEINNGNESSAGSDSE